MIKACIATAGVLFSIILYCCIVAGKRVDEQIEKLFEEEFETEERKM